MWHCVLADQVDPGTVALTLQALNCYLPAEQRDSSICGLNYGQKSSA
jgi:hypothetical protein